MCHDIQGYRTVPLFGQIFMTDDACYDTQEYITATSFLAKYSYIYDRRRVPRHIGVQCCTSFWQNVSDRRGVPRHIGVQYCTRYLFWAKYLRPTTRDTISWGYSTVPLYGQNINDRLMEPLCYGNVGTCPCTSQRTVALLWCVQYIWQISHVSVGMLRMRRNYCCSVLSQEVLRPHSFFVDLSGLAWYPSRPITSGKLLSSGLQCTLWLYICVLAT